MRVGDLVRHIKPYSDAKMGIILKPVPKGFSLNDLWLVHWFDTNPFDEQCNDYDLQVIG